MIYGLFGAIMAIIASFCGIFGFLKFKSNKQKIEELQKNHQSEIAEMKERFEQEKADLQKAHDDELIQIKKKNQEKDEELKSKVSLAEKSFKKKLSEKDSKIYSLQVEVGTLMRDKKAFTEKYARIQKLHPSVNFEEEVAQMIEDEYKAKAKVIDDFASTCMSLHIDKVNIQTFNMAIERINNANPNVKKYIQTDVNKLKEMLFKSKAKQIDECVLQVSKLYADKDRISTFEKAIAKIESADPNVKKYVTANLDTLHKLLSDSKEMLRAYEEEMNLMGFTPIEEFKVNEKAHETNVVGFKV